MQRIKKQRGLTLISLMIGTAFSMLTILAMLALYKNLIQFSIEATQDANHDGGLASAMLIAQLELQNAGFGINKDFDETVFIHNTASTNALLWYYKLSPTDNTKQCAGLIERQHPGKDKKHFRTLTLLQQSDCTLNLEVLSAADPVNTGWETVTNLAILKKPEPAQQLLKFTKTTEICSGNYYSSIEGNHPAIKITAMSSSALHNTDKDQLKIMYTVCLSNILSPAQPESENNEDNP